MKAGRFELIGRRFDKFLEKTQEGHQLSFHMDELRKPQVIIQVLQGLGWHLVQDTHTHDCPRNLGRGNRCNCVPDAPTWSAPKGVYAYMGEDWNSRLAKAQAKKDDD